MEGVKLALNAAAPARRLGSAELPPEAPLAMPTQSLTQAPAKAPRPASSPPSVALRRAALWLSVSVIAGLGTWSVARELSADTFGPLDWPVLAVFALLFAWGALSFLTACAGARAMLTGRSPLDIDSKGPPPRPMRRTALLVPIFNEDPAAVFARVQAVCEDIAGAGASKAFDVFVLSDSTDERAKTGERRCLETLRRRLDGGCQVYFRRRAFNTDRKAGNIADWVRRFGGAYDFMIVLDADSLMSADAALRLVGAMERAPGVGVIQTLPMIVGHGGLFGRAQQFASRLYGPLIAHGIAWWSGAEGNYWGHNAIIRTSAFAGRGGLPQLPGKAPFGGSIMSHDFVEAALMRRGGWAVHLAPQIGGSYEGCPPSLADTIKRDRRWCQGNLQHLGVFAARGLHWVSRLHLLTGVSAFLTAPLWLALLALNLVLSADPALGRGAGFHGPAPLAAGIPWTFIAASFFFLSPRLLAYGVAMADPGLRQGFGGRRRGLAGVLAETLISGLVAPVVMVSQTLSLLQLLLGRDFGWTAQRRAAATGGLRAALLRHWSHTAIGLAVSGVALLVARSSILWLTPVLPSLVFSAPLAELLTHGDVGRWARRAGLLRTPEETSPPPLVSRAGMLEADYAEPPDRAAGATVRLFPFPPRAHPSLTLTPQLTVEARR